MKRFLQHLMCWVLLIQVAAISIDLAGHLDNVKFTCSINDDQKADEKGVEKDNDGKELFFQHTSNAFQDVGLFSKGYSHITGYFDPHFDGPAGPPPDMI